MVRRGHGVAHNSKQSSNNEGYAGHGVEGDICEGWLSGALEPRYGYLYHPSKSRSMREFSHAGHHLSSQTDRSLAVKQATELRRRAGDIVSTEVNVNELLVNMTAPGGQKSSREEAVFGTAMGQLNRPESGRCRYSIRQV